MYNFLCITISLLLFTTLPFEVVSKQKDIHNFDQLISLKPVKRFVYSCNFEKIVSMNYTSFADICQYDKLSQKQDYIAFFIPPAIINADYIKNYYRQLILDNKSFAANMLKVFSNKDNPFETMIFDNITYSTYAISGNNKAAIFIGWKDLLLRYNMYPSLAVLDILPPPSGKTKYLSDYEIKYTVRPFILMVPFIENWVSYFLGLPLYSELEYQYKKFGPKKVFTIFDNISSFNRKQSIRNSYDYSLKDVGVGEFATPFISKDKLLDRLPFKDGEGFLHEYLPQYSLITVEIIEREKNGSENVLISYNANDLAKFFINPNEFSGIFFITDINRGNSLSIRYTHKAMKPRYRDEGILRSNFSGLNIIYSNIGKTIITDIDISKFYPMKKIPERCLDLINAESLIKKKEIINGKKYLSYFSDRLKPCSLAEKDITNIFFGPKFDDIKVLIP